MEYLTLNFGSDRAWEELARLQCFKAYVHFDSLILPEPLDFLAYKFKYVKRMIAFMLKNLPEMKSTNLISQARIGVLNALKIK